MFKKIEGVTALILLFVLITTLFIRLFGIETRIILSDSMAPEYRVNDLVYINQLTDTEKLDLAVGDVIAFSINGKEILHRIILITSEEVTTKGDNNDSPDNPVSYQQINAKVLVNIPFGGYLFNVYLWVIFIGLYGVIFVSTKLFKELKKRSI